MGEGVGYSALLHGFLFIPLNTEFFELCREEGIIPLCSMVPKRGSLNK